MTSSSAHIDQQTIEQLARRDAGAFTRIYHLYYPELFLLARRITGDKEKAADVVADVFLQLWTRNPSLDHPRHLLAYLRAMTRNACLYQLKQGDRYDKMLTDFASLNNPDYEEQYFREIIESRLFRLINHEINTLPKHLREVFTLSYKDGLSNAEIAARLKLSDGSVRVLKSEALKQLRLALQHVELAVLLQLLSTTAQA